MSEMVHIGGSQRLAPGYYFAKISGDYCRNSWSMRLEPEPAANAITAVPLALGDFFLLRLFTPVTVTLAGNVSNEASRPVLHTQRLPKLLAAGIKLLRYSRLKRRVPLLGGGYLCVLSALQTRENFNRFREYMLTQSRLFRYGLHDANIPFVQSFDDPPERLIPPPKPWQSVLPATQAKAAVVLHLYYTDLWPEISAFLTNMQRPFDLWITHCHPDTVLEAQIRQVFPHAHVRLVENRGRDIWPFVSLLNEGVLSGYNYICKIHSKKSAHTDGRGEELLGLRWRRRALYDLLGPGRPQAIMAMFERDPSLGLVGPAQLRLPNAVCSVKTAWGVAENRRNALALARRMGAETKSLPLDFFAGSMFWVSSTALEPIRQLNLRRDNFPDERGQLEGETQHALERLFSFAAHRSGRHVADVPPMTVAHLLGR